MMSTLLKSLMPADFDMDKVTEVVKMKSDQIDATASDVKNLLLGIEQLYLLAVEQQKKIDSLCEKLNGENHVH